MRHTHYTEFTATGDLAANPDSKYQDTWTKGDVVTLIDVPVSAKVIVAFYFQGWHDSAPLPDGVHKIALKIGHNDARFGFKAHYDNLPNPALCDQQIQIEPQPTPVAEFTSSDYAPQW